MSTPEPVRSTRRGTASQPCRGALRGDEAGIGLVEVVIAMFVLSVALLGLASAGITSMRSLSDSQFRQRATAMATESLELARSYTFERVANEDGDHAFTDFDPENGTDDDPGSTEELITDPAGEVTGEVHHADDGRLELRTYVTDPADPDDVDARRVTAVVRYSVPGATEREVRFSTLIAEAARGLGQPDFDVAPPSDTLTMTRNDDGEDGPNDENGEGREDICIPHTITNRGARSAFELELPDPADLPSADLDVVAEENDGGSWVVLGSGSPTQDIGEGESLDVRVCYEQPTDSSEFYDDVEAAERAYVFDTSITIRPEGREEPEQVQTLAHTVEIELERELFLYPAFNDDGEVDDIDNDLTQTFGLSPVPPSNGHLFDYDDDGDGGLRLEAGDEPAPYDEFQADGDASGSAVRFSYTFPDERVVGDQSSLSLWLRTDDPGDDFELQVRLERVRDDGSLDDAATLADGTRDLVIDGEGWGRLELGINHPSTFFEDDQLVLTIACIDDTDPDDETAEPADCHLAYGTDDRDSSLTVAFP